jgi:hypothetical protein
MIEVYVFLAIFLVQILVMSVLFPARLIKYTRAAQATGIHDEHLAQTYPGVDHNVATEHFLTRIRAGSAVVVAVGLLALGWMFNYMQQPGWGLPTVMPVIVVYAMLQFVPLLFAGALTYRFYKTHLHTVMGGKRTATLARRGLFDFVSPSVVILAIAAYVLVIAFVIYAQPKPLVAGVLIGSLTFVYLLEASSVYRALYGKKSALPETDDTRTQRIGLTAKLTVYICILNSAFFALVVALDLWNLKNWAPTAASAFFVTASLLMISIITGFLRRAAEQPFGTSPTPRRL